ncbi:methyl-accepting chemotaxis protein [Arenibaculum sp.]|uniref:methyl-accepting chemotaxis protein n=1 Tax=Arenibaculum sp. TaxID=2865862 RepID=UPI002E1202C0|nr:methyl-accepting chemotaxis protein [Arenibaculum sp.]
MVFANLRIVHKLLLLVGFLSVVTALVSAVGIVSLQHMTEAAARIDRAGSQSLTAARANRDVVELNRAEFRIAADPTGSNLEDSLRVIEEQRRLFEERLREFSDTTDPRTRDLAAAVADGFQQYEASLAKTIETARGLGGEVRIDVAQQTIRDAALASRDAATDLQARLRALTVYTDEKATQTNQEAAALARRDQTILVAVAVFGVLGGAAVGYLIASYGVARPMTRSVTALRRLAEGDVGAEIFGAGRRDEIGEIAQTMTVFRDNLVRNREMERQAAENEARAAEERRRSMLELADRFDDRVGGIVDTVSTAASEMQATAQQLAAAVEETSRQSTAVAAAANQASANVQTVAAASEELSATIQQVSSQVAETAGQSRGAASRARTAQADLDRLATAIAQVAEIVDAIGEVAAQTNLLALNATIESARAGEAGKGFAVVASEVKNLAGQTRLMTERIREQMNAVQSAADSTVGVMTAIIAQVEDIDQAAAGMASAVEQQSAATLEISRNAQQAAQGTEEVTGSITGVQGAAEQTGQAAVSVRDAAGGLARQARDLEQAVATFLAEVRAA